MAFDIDLGDIGLFEVPKITVEGFEGAEAADGFELSDEEDQTTTRIWTRPVVRRPQAVAYEYAEEFARAVALDGRTETFAFVSGNFVFGDFMEALVMLRGVDVRRMSIMTLSMSERNINSIRNIIDARGVERLDLALSAYWYANERGAGGLVGYLFEELDVEGLELHVAFAGIHCKTWAIETAGGGVVTMTGSANLRSSRNVEQVHVTPDRGVFEFVDGFTQSVIEAYDVVNQEQRRARTVRSGELWRQVAAGGAGRGRAQR